ncbi:MAG: CbiX/SirB N-terminal domain-containing protein [Pseudoprimorskyibacter sp.]|nr:CbiX/SirB N-terminal domain-containing protein [Pseudoprimorskyibacter sp.]
MTQAIIVSHGQPSDPQIGEAEIAALARSVSAYCDFSVSGVTLASPGALEAQMDLEPDAVVYPMFMTNGWFTRVELPRRIGDRAVRILPPFGTDPALAPAVAKYLTSLCHARGWDIGDVGLAILGHGSGRSDAVARETFNFVEAVKTDFEPARLTVGFVEQDPPLSEALDDLGPKSFILPFFAARRGHVLDDIPQAAAKKSYCGHILEPVGLLDFCSEMIAHKLAKAI